MLSKLFPMPQNDGLNAAASATVLQTRAQLSTIIQQKLGKALPGSPQDGALGTNGQDYLQQQVQQAKSALDQLKNKVSKLGGSSSNMVIPDFKPNSQKTKTIWSRLVYGLNIQNTPGNNFFPATSNIAAMLGYKINDNVETGAGAAYLLGWGSPVKNIHFSNQGIGLRSYLQIRAKKSYWFTGGFEENYSQTATLNSANRIYYWQNSLLAGITKKYKVGKETCNLQLLYDFLANQEIPKTSGLKFRVGYTF
jgi:hypothetical protein